MNASGAQLWSDLAALAPQAQRHGGFGTYMGMHGDGTLLRALFHLAQELGLPAPVESLGGGHWGYAYTTTHRRQVVKFTADPQEIFTWLAIYRKWTAKAARKLFCGVVHVEVMAWSNADGKKYQDVWGEWKAIPRPALAVIWKERLKPVTHRAMECAMDMADDFMLTADTASHNTGLRGRNHIEPRAFDGWLSQKLTRRMLGKADLGCLTSGHRVSFLTREGVTEPSTQDTPDDALKSFVGRPDPLSFDMEKGGGERYGTADTRDKLDQLKDIAL